MFSFEKALRIIVKSFQETLCCQMTRNFFVEILASSQDFRITLQREGNREIWLVWFEIFPCLLLLLNTQILMLAFQAFDNCEWLSFSSKMNFAASEIWIINLTICCKLGFIILRRLNSGFWVHYNIFWSVNDAKIWISLLRFFLSRCLWYLRFLYLNFPFLV